MASERGNAGATTELFIAVSFLPYLAIAALPAVGVSGTALGAGIGALFIAAEVVFFLGVVVVGRDTWRAVRRHGWRRTPRALWHLLRWGPESDPLAR